MVTEQHWVNTSVSSPMKVVPCLMEVEAAVVAIKTSASPKEYDAMLCILKCDYDVRPKICRGTYVAINKLVTKSYKIIFKRMMT